MFDQAYLANVDTKVWKYWWKEKMDQNEWKSGLLSGFCFHTWPINPVIPVCVLWLLWNNTSAQLMLYSTCLQSWRKLCFLRTSKFDGFYSRNSSMPRRQLSKMLELFSPLSRHFAGSKLRFCLQTLLCPFLFWEESAPTSDCKYGTPIR